MRSDVEQNGIFRTAAMGGFNKQDVLDYIAVQSNKNKQLTKELDETKKALDGANVIVRKLERELLDKKTAYDTLYNEHVTKGKELSSTYDAMLDKLSLQEKELRSLAYELKCEKERSIEPGIAARTIKEANEQIENALREANEAAESIIAQAYERKREITAQTRAYKEETIKKLAKYRADIDMLRADVGQALGDVDTALIELGHSIEETGKRAMEDIC